MQHPDQEERSGVVKQAGEGRDTTGVAVDAGQKRRQIAAGVLGLAQPEMAQHGVQRAMASRQDIGLGGTGAF